MGKCKSFPFLYYICNMKTITEITWNWSPALMETNGDRIDVYSDTCETANIKDPDVKKIEQYKCDSFPCFVIYYLDGKIKEVYKPNTVTYEEH